MANKSKAVKFNPAGKADNFKIVATDINNIIENERFEMKVATKGVQVEPLSIELEEGVSIKAYDDTLIDFVSRKNEIIAKDKIVKFNKEGHEDNDRDVI